MGGRRVAGNTHIALGGVIMRKIALIFIGIIVLSLSLWGKEITLQVEAGEAVLGVPLQLTGRICNGDKDYWVLDSWRLVLVDTAESWEEKVEKMPGKQVDIGDPFWHDVIRIEAGDCQTVITGKEFAHPGTYHVKWVYRPNKPYWKAEKMYKNLGGFQHMYQKNLESNETTVVIREPEGVDDKAWMWALEEARKGETKYHGEVGKERFAVDLASTLSGNSWTITLTGKIRTCLLEHFPTSTYAGWVVAPFLGKFDKADPKRIFTLIENKKYNPWNSVPYPGTKDGWKGLRGAELAKWQNEWILKILKDHPDFAWNDRLQLTLAVNYYYLGRDKEAERILKSLGTGRTSSVGGWARRFLNLVKVEKMRKHTPESLPTVGK